VARVLVVEDEASVRLALKLGLERAGFAVVEAASAAEAWGRFADVDLVVLDWMLPDEPGLRLLERLRGHPRGQRLPVLMLTAKGAEADRVAGLLGGADDYLTKPYSLAELVARLKALLRRAGKLGEIRRGALFLDLDRRQVFLAGRALSLTRREFDLLATLAAEPGRVFTREMLIDRVWGADYLGTPRTVDQHVAQLREKLGPGWIETVRGQGYRFSEET
jgi:DNA-binding response OmpR family regulator